MIEPRFAFSKTPTIEALNQIWSSSRGRGGEATDMSWTDLTSMSKLKLRVTASQVSPDPVWSLQLDTGKDMITLGTLMSSNLDTVLEFVNKHFNQNQVKAQAPRHGRPLRSISQERPLRPHPALMNFAPTGENDALELNQGIPTKMALQFERSVTNPETGALALPVFLYMLNHEFKRQTHNGAPFSLLLLGLQIKGNPAEDEIPGITQTVAERLMTIKRSSDLIAEFGASNLLMLLHDTDHRGATVLTRRIQNAIKYPPIHGLSELGAQMACGIASAPEDAQSMEALLDTVKQPREVTEL